MLKSTFTAFFRSFTRHPLYALADLLGLSLGIAVFITLGLFVRFETTFEQWVPNSQNLYEVEIRGFQGQPGYQPRRRHIRRHARRSAHRLSADDRHADHEQ